MSNSTTNAGRASNTDWHYRVLLGLQNILEAQGGDDTILTNIQNILSSTVRTPGRSIHQGVGGSGTIAPGFRSFTVTNLGSTDALLDGELLFPGQSNTFDAGGQANTLLGMSFDAQASILEIITVL